MSQPTTESVRISTSSPSSLGSSSLADEPELHGIWLLLGKIGWGVLALSTILVTLVLLPAYVTVLRMPCSVNAPSCNNFQLTPEQVRRLTSTGLTLGTYATYVTITVLLLVMVNFVVSALIMWRRSHLRIGLVVALALLVFYTFDPTNLIQGGTFLWLILAKGLGYLSSVFILLLGLMFPSGRFAPRWAILACLVLLVALLFDSFFPTLVAFPLIIGVQTYRYRRVSTPKQRQQTKWVVYGVVLALGITAVLEGLSLFLVVLGRGYSSPAAQLVELVNIMLAPWLALCITLAFAAAVLRSHLWDIDVLINQTLVYGGLSAILGVLYAGLIIGLESLVGKNTGQAGTNPLVLVVSTLAIVALVQPLRRRLQNVVDRRFYRPKYDAEQTLADFSATLRQEVDLEQVRAQLLSVVQETMQPAQVSLWLCAPQDRAITVAVHTPESPGTPSDPSLGTQGRL